jgi:hypothetical protein
MKAVTCLYCAKHTETKKIAHMQCQSNNNIKIM